MNSEFKEGDKAIVCYEVSQEHDIINTAPKGTVVTVIKQTYEDLWRVYCNDPEKYFYVIGNHLKKLPKGGLTEVLYED